MNREHEATGMEAYSIWEDAQRMLVKAKADGTPTIWDRLAEHKVQCKFCEQGLSCAKCTMGPCSINPRGPKKTRGICGADADLTVARNFGRFVAAGASAHSDHGRDLLETLAAVGRGEVEDYVVRDEGKLRRICEELGLPTADRSVRELAAALADRLYQDYGSRSGALSFLGRVPEKRLNCWKTLGITPRGIDREVVEMMHRTHIGVDCDPVSILLHAARTALSDGWGGSSVATELSDILFGTPEPRVTMVNLGALKESHVNILVHGHSPIVSEMILAAALDPEMIEQARQAGAAGINVAGLCCTGNELLMRQGMAMAGNHLMSELAIITGAVELMVVDYQCIMPSLVQVAHCYHTRFVSTSEKARYPGGVHIDFTLANARIKAREVVAMAIAAFGERQPDRVDIPCEPVEMFTGFSNEAIVTALGGTLAPLVAAITSGAIRGVAAIVGCNNPKIKHDSAHVTLASELIKANILVLVTGCATVAMGKAGLMQAGAASLAGEGLGGVCRSLGIPPVLHVGSCVDNSRIIQLCGLLAKELGLDISDLPVVASAPEWHSEKAAAIGLYAVSSGVYTHLGLPPHILGSAVVTGLALGGLENVVGASFAVESDPLAAAALLIARINTRREALGLTI